MEVDPVNLVIGEALWERIKEGLSSSYNFGVKGGGEGGKEREGKKKTLFSLLSQIQCLPLPSSSIHPPIFEASICLDSETRCSKSRR